MNPIVRRYPDLRSLTLASCEFIAHLARQSVSDQGVFSVALSGGRTPLLLYETLARPPMREGMPWSLIHFFWGDERCVAPDRPESNYALAFEALLSKIPVPSDHIHRIPAEREPPDEAARAYERTLREFFLSADSSRVATDQKVWAFPSFDLILLGVGKDGHTASLFPGDRAVRERKRWVIAVTEPAGSPPVSRITMTLPVINSAKNVLFLVSGDGKAEVIRTILEGPETVSDSYPAARVRPRGSLLWFIDEGGIGP